MMGMSSKTSTFVLLPLLILFLSVHNEAAKVSAHAKVCDSPFWPAGVVQNKQTTRSNHGGRRSLRQQQHVTDVPISRSSLSGGNVSGGNESSSRMTALGGEGRRKFLADEGRDLLWQIAHAEIVSGKEGEGEKLWKLMEEHAKFKEEAAASKETPQSFPSKWKKGITGKISSDPSKLKPAWCKNIATCNLQPSVDQIMTSVKSAVVFGLAFIPEVGPVLSAVVDFLWPEFEDEKKSTWDEIKDQVKREIKISIDRLLFALAKNHMDEIKDKYNGDAGYVHYAKNSTFAPEAWLNMYNFINDNMCKILVVGDDHELGLLPIFVQAANMQLLLLREGIHNAALYPDVWKWDRTTDLTDGRTLMQVYEDALLHLIIVYGSYVDALYQHQLKDYTLPVTDPNKQVDDPNQCLAAQEAWTNRNNYIRYMTLNIMDYRTTWLYMHPTIFPYPGVHVTLERTIYSDPIGSRHYHEQQYGDINIDFCFDYQPFVYPTPPKENNRLSYLRGTGTDFVRSLKLGYPDGQRKELHGYGEDGAEAFVLDAGALQYNPVYRIDYGVSYLVAGSGIRGDPVTTRNHIQYLTFALANGSAIYLSSVQNGGGVPAEFQKLQEVVVGSYNPPGDDNGYALDHVDRGNIKFDGHVMSDATFMGGTPCIDGVSVAVFSFRLEDSYPSPPAPPMPPMPPPPPYNGSCTAASYFAGIGEVYCQIMVNNCAPEVAIAPKNPTKVADLHGKPLQCSCICK
ncbi:hypothetical protein CEUSTIGMA_g9131.t1 [Chlamydomonas eustigma]|uniref:Pesticidal crystal protein domain-containing protein n=1 Tax=Chlamydomonas eustigma TaxID=1157962 RepID=A0A250XF79_9CHLO|nr:hypothetical protein CEUSTIGMA_g9131.t1 [Chlamydomonas eustigma]|eukprot:GAX81703.1 hypothetical protein CEUSTIGMA_g9131.t1 [Chlamydomonas eustigma]